MINEIVGGEEELGVCPNFKGLEPLLQLFLYLLISLHTLIFVKGRWS